MPELVSVVNLVTTEIGTNGMVSATKSWKMASKSILANPVSKSMKPLESFGVITIFRKGGSGMPRKRVFENDRAGIFRLEPGKKISALFPSLVTLN